MNKIKNINDFDKQTLVLEAHMFKLEYMFKYYINEYIEHKDLSILKNAFISFSLIEDILYRFQLHSSFQPHHFIYCYEKMLLMNHTSIYTYQKDLIVGIANITGYVHAKKPIEETVIFDVFEKLLIVSLYFIPKKERYLFLMFLQRLYISLHDIIEDYNEAAKFYDTPHSTFFDFDNNEVTFFKKMYAINLLFNQCCNYKSTEIVLYTKGYAKIILKQKENFKYILSKGFKALF